MSERGTWCTNFIYNEAATAMLEAAMLNANPREVTIDIVANTRHFLAGTVFVSWRGGEEFHIEQILKTIEGKIDDGDNVQVAVFCDNGEYAVFQVGKMIVKRNDWSAANDE